MSSSSSMPKLVLVSGANGYIGSSLVESLLEQGYRVRGTVRDPTNESKTAALKAMPNAATHLELVPLDLTGPGGDFLAAMEGVEWVMHTASPVTLRKPKDEQTEIRPAVEGTLGMLRAAHKTPTVRKFILTSSVAAIKAGHDEENKAFSEDDWSNLDGAQVTTYAKSKTLAERAAWRFMKDNTPSFTLSTINPGLVLGPVPSADVKSSVQILAEILNPRMPGSINLFFNVVDIRDVVKAHIQAAKIPEAAGKRFILSQSDGGELFMPEIGAILHREFGPMGYDIKTWVLPKWFVWLLSWVNADVASMYFMIDRRVHYDNTRSREILQLEYRNAEQTIIDGGHSLIQHGIVPQKPGYRNPVKNESSGQDSS